MAQTAPSSADALDPQAWRHIDPPSPTLADIVEAHARTRPHHPALEDGDTVLDWRGLAAQMRGAAAALSAAGVGPGSRVLLLSGNSLKVYALIFAAWRLGAIPVPVSPLLGPDSLGRIIDDCRPAIAIFSDVLRELIGAANERSDHAVRLEALSQFTFEESKSAPAAAVAPDAPATIIYSSGTTGRPKGIVHTHQARLWMAASLAVGLRYSHRSRTLVSTPPFTNGSWVMILPALVNGSTIRFTASFDPAECLALLDRGGITHSFFVPTQFTAMVGLPGWGSADFGNVETLLSAGAPLPPKLRETIEAKAPGKLHELWGLTEGLATIATPEDLQERPGTVGLPNGGSEIRLIDEDGHEVARGEEGEIVGSSLGLMAGYLNVPEANETLLWHDPHGKVMLRTGDVASQDEDGYLYLRGRRKDMILSGGVNVYPIDIETVFLRHHAVIDAAVIGTPDEKWGEHPVAFVRTREPISEDALVEWSLSHLDKYQRVSAVVNHDGDFPRNALGKVQKNILAERYAKRISE